MRLEIQTNGVSLLMGGKPRIFPASKLHYTPVKGMRRNEERKIWGHVLVKDLNFEKRIGNKKNESRLIVFK